MSKKNWQSLKQLLDELNKNCNYIILRNYENLSDESYYMEGHDDIDFLCDNRKKIYKTMGCRRSLLIRSKDHFFIKIKDVDVKVGIRYVGDGYYDKKWEENMLSSRRMHSNAFFIMQQKDYFYSLIYHALLQKKVFSEDYKKRLSVMGKEFGVSAFTEREWLEVLRDYLKNNNYIISAPVDLVVPMRKDLICSLSNNEYDEGIIRGGGYKCVYILATGAVYKFVHKIARIFLRK